MNNDEDMECFPGETIKDNVIIFAIAFIYVCIITWIIDRITKNEIIKINEFDAVLSEDRKYNETKRFWSLIVIGVISFIAGVYVVKLNCDFRLIGKGIAIGGGLIAIGAIVDAFNDRNKIF